MADWCGRGSGLKGSWGRFHLAASWLQSHDESAPIAGRSGHEPQSWTTIVVQLPSLPSDEDRIDWAVRFQASITILCLFVARLIRIQCPKKSPRVAMVRRKSESVMTVWWRSGDRVVPLIVKDRSRSMKIGRSRSASDRGRSQPSDEDRAATHTLIFYEN